MIILGIILLVVGYFTGLSILYTIGGILLVIGVILWILGDRKSTRLNSSH